VCVASVLLGGFCAQLCPAADVCATHLALAESDLQLLQCSVRTVGP
jgi:hypothetical protein